MRGPSPPGTPHPSWRKSPHFVKIPPLEDSMAHAGTAADQLRPSSGGAMPSPVANAWVRPLKGTVAARNGNGSAGAAPRNPNGHSAVRAGGTKNGHGHDRVKDQHDDPHATAEPHPTKTKTVAPPPTNPWKTPMVEGVSSNIPPFPLHFPWWPAFPLASSSLLLCPSWEHTHVAPISWTSNLSSCWVDGLILYCTHTNHL